MAEQDLWLAQERSPFEMVFWKCLLRSPQPEPNSPSPILYSGYDLLLASDAQANAVWALVQSLQLHFVHDLEALGQTFAQYPWKRDGGQHGGGYRCQAQEDGFFNRASINISQVHYEDEASRPLDSATALSAIVHPDDPNFPSMHLHISFTKRKGEDGSWRFMADLNPSLPTPLGTVFREELQVFNVQAGVDAFAQGDQYFWIPTLKRHRGVSHFYLEAYQTDHPGNDLVFAQDFGKKVIATYLTFLTSASSSGPSEEQRQQQLQYHTLYFFQVLLLDRGTTAGLLVHHENDEGILGSLPSRIDLDLLRQWRKNLPNPQGILLDSLLGACGSGPVVEVGAQLKKRLADVLREHYRRYPETADFQARGFVLPNSTSPHLKQP